MAIQDLTGQKFGRLTVLEYKGPAKDRGAMWLCECECGNKPIVRANNLRSGKSRSCGCLARERAIEKCTRHNMSNTSLYYAWNTMRSRCSNPKSHKYKMYGARGIKVCKEWENDFKKFYDYVSQLPHFEEKGRTLDRINDNGNYEPGNVRWATPGEQANNTRRNVFFEVNGIRYSPREYAEKYGEPYDKVYYKYILKPREEAKKKGEKTCQ